MMKNRTKLIGMLVVAALALGQAGHIHAADANPPERMTYQGYLVDGNGDPLGNSVPANYDVVFRIYNIKEGGTTDNILWAEQQTVTVDKGYFSVLLGEGVPTSNGDPTGKLSGVFGGTDASDRFIGITVKGLGAGDVEIAPRLQFVASPFTFLAAYARQADKIVGTGGDVLTTDGGNIGIGNASPNSKLDVGGDIKASGAVDVGGNANVQGSLAVGKSSAPTAALDVAGAIKASSGLDIDGDSTIDGSVNLRPTGTSSALRIYASSNYSDYQLKLWNDDSASYIRNTSDSRKIIIGANDRNTLALTPDGKVGINNAGPSYDLDVDGTIRAFTGNSSKPGLIIDRYSTGNYRSELVQASDGLAIRVGHGSTEPTEKMRIKYDGNVWMPGWIVRTAHNTGGLMGAYNHLGGAAQASNPIYILGSSYKPNETTLGNMYGVGYTDWTASFITGTGSGWGFYVASGGKARTWLSGNSGAVSYIAKDGGRVGIGTDSPSQALDVNGNIKLRGGAIVGSGSNYLVIEDYGSNNGCTIRPHSNNYGSIGTANLRWDDGYITELWASMQGSDRRIKRDINPVGKNEMLEMIDDMSFYQYRLRFPNAEKMKRQGRDANGVFYGIMAQELREIYPNVVKSNGEAALLDENETDEDEILKNRWYVEKARLAELALGGIKDLYSISKEKDSEIESLKSKVENLESEMAVLKARLANSTTQEDRIAKLEDLVSKIAQGQ